MIPVFIFIVLLQKSGVIVHVKYIWTPLLTANDIISKPHTHTEHSTYTYRPRKGSH